MSTFTIQHEQEEDGRWIAEVPELPGVLAYGPSPHESSQLSTGSAGPSSANPALTRSFRGPVRPTLSSLSTIAKRSGRGCYLSIQSTPARSRNHCARSTLPP